MQLGTQQAERSISDLMKEGYSIEHATLITKCNINHIKQLLKVLFKYGNIYPNRYVSKRGYTVHQHDLETFLQSENIIYFIRNEAPRGAINGINIQLKPFDPNRVIVFNLTQGEDWVIINSDKKLLRGCSNATQAQIKQLCEDGYIFEFKIYNKSNKLMCSGVSKQETMEPLFITDSNPNKATRNRIDFKSPNKNNFVTYY
jgi:hypothetical protein